MIAGLHAALLIALWKTGLVPLPMASAPIDVRIVSEESARAPAPPPPLVPPRAAPVRAPTLDIPLIETPTVMRIEATQRPVVTPPSPAPVAAVATPPAEPAPVAVAAPPAPPAPPPPAAPRQIAIGQVRYLSPPVLDYPMAARRAQLEGRAEVRVLVDEDGQPRQVQLQRSTGHASLDEAALAAARATRFKPYTENGRALAFWVVMPLTFELEI